MVMDDLPPQSPRPMSTLRRNPPRRAKQNHTITPFPLLDLPQPPQIPPKPKAKPEPDLSSFENLRVFLRVRPLEIRPRPAKASRPTGRAKAPSPKKPGANKSKNESVCLAVTDSNTVTLSAPPSSSDAKRSKCEVYDGFSYVFPQESLQEDVYERVMDPLVMDFMDGKDALLAAMGPTGSGKTYTMFGSPREPGIMPLALRRIFGYALESRNPQPTRLYYLSMFEIYSERGKGERIFDLSPNGADLSFQQLPVKGLQEVRISNATEAESLVASGLLKRSTAATSANDQSSRSQCIITIRSALENIDDENDYSSYSAVLTIADLAGAEREKKTGNQGAKLLESNFINNTSMVFGLCLRSLLEHQKNPKRSVEKHFKNSLLTRYLREYLEGKKRMTLILTVKPGENDYLDTSFLLRQASPYMKIRFTSLEEFPNMLCQKRSTSSLIRIEHHKRRKCVDSEVSKGDHGKSEKDALAGRRKSEKGVNFEKIKETETETQQISNISPECLRTSPMGAKVNELQCQLARMRRNDEVMKNFAKALWSVLKQYKNKYEETENEVRILKETLQKETDQARELKRKLKDVASCCSCQINPCFEELSRSEVDAPYANARGTTVSSTSPDNSKKSDCEVDSHITQEPVCQTPEISSASINDEDAHGLKGILAGYSKSALPSVLERSSLILEGDKLAGQIADSLPGTEYPHEDIEPLTSLDVSLPSNINLIDSAADHSYSIARSSGPDYSQVGKYILINEDEKLETHDDEDLLNLVKDSDGETNEECKSSLGIHHYRDDLLELSNLRVTGTENSDPLVACVHSCSVEGEETSRVDLLELSNLRVTGTINSDPSVACVHSCSVVGEETSILPTSCRQDAKVEVPHTVHSSLYVKENFTGNSNEVETFQEHKDNHEDQEGIKDLQQHKLDLYVPEKDTHDVRGHVKTGKHDHTSKPVTSEKPRRRRLLPVSNMLLKEFSGINMEEENMKEEGRGKPTAEGRGRSQGSISLVRLLKSNLHI